MFTFIEDPGHGWLEVTTQDLARVGMTCQNFTRYSYRRGNTLYLEEDCDAPRFLEAWRRKNGGRPDVRPVYQARTFIRDLPAIHP
jgi:predicted nucleotidyltransferase